VCLLVARHSRPPHSIVWTADNVPQLRSEYADSTILKAGYGGKGANQAVACARLAPEDVKVQMMGNLGDDNFGRDYLQALKKEGIDASLIRTVGGKTGVSTIIVEEDTGENRIMFTPGANYAFPEQVVGAPAHKEWGLVPQDADVVVLQLEIPLPVVRGHCTAILLLED
jgi:ribokinase